MHAKIIFHDLTEFRHLYWEGWPESRMARHFKVRRPIIRRTILELGLLPRSRLESNRFLAEERPLAARRAQTAAASASRWKASDR